ncbi:GAP1-N1 domain-containing protein [Shewanella woodyi]|uniref:GAP1-N1 domain-containing protein n=1 Tax=Shewanella woodyi TaxID=60961 RepID=UPI0007F9554B|nr:effector-associated domain EAD1-containing protein [Shewanella woodyi]
MIKEPLKATYGCKDNSHELLTWNGDSPPPRELLGLTDKPGGHIIPTEKWWPVINCGPVGGLWALWCIEPDFEAPRGGMVKSTVLLWDLNSASQLNDIKKYVLQLVSAYEQKGPAPQLLINVANELVSNSDVLVTDSIESLPFILSCLWENLWGEARKEFSVRVAFTPPQVFERKNQPTLYCVPPSVVNQWYLPGVTIIKSSEAKCFRAANYLIGLEDSDLTLQDILLNCGELNSDLKVLNKLGRAADNIDEFKKNSTLKNAITALRSVITCSPLPDNASTVKNELLTSIQKLMNTRADAPDILTMSNLLSDAVPQGSMSEEVLTAWIAEHILELDSEYQVKFFERAQNGKSVPWWLDGVVNGIRVVVNNPNYSGQILHWITLEHFQNIFTRLPSVREQLEQSLFESAIVSDFTPENLKIIETFSISQGWAKLHAWAVFNIYDEDQVYRKQSDSMPNWVEGVPFLIERLSDELLAKLLGDQSFTAFIDLLAERALKKPSILNHIDIEEAGALLLWQKQLENGGRIYPPNVSKEVFQEKLCSSLHSGLFSSIFDQVSKEVSAHLLSKADRAEIWSLLKPLECKTLANNLVKIAVSNPQLLRGLSHQEKDLIDELKKYIECTSNIEPEFIISFLSQSINHSERDVLRWIKKNNSKSWDSYAKSLGMIVLKNQWSAVANDLYKSSFGFLSSTPHFKPTVETCSELLSSRNKLFLTVFTGQPTHTSRYEVIRLFSEISSDLAHDRLEFFWQKAGGKLGQLKLQGTESDKWLHAANEAENGALNRGLRSLLEVLIEEYPNNTQLQEVKQLIERGK